MQLKHQLMLGAGLVVALSAGAADAQQRPATRAAAAAATTSTLEELVVTAEKREQNLQDVPIAITAFSDKTRDVVGIQSIQDMTNFTPGLQYSTSTDRVSLRGLGRLTNVLSADASVANYADGVYETFAVRAGASTLFTDRVEVLRGPQGTLYGRNAIAGALNIISKRPTEDWYGEVRGSYGNYNHGDLEGAISGPLFIPNWQFRLAGQWEKQTEGYIKNTVPGMPSEGNVIDTTYIEGQIQGKFNDKLEMWSKFGFTYWHNGAGGPGSQSGGWSPAIYSANPAKPNTLLPPVQNGIGAGWNGWDINEFYNAATSFNPGFGCSGLAQNVITAGPSPCINASSTSPWLVNRPIAYRVHLPNAFTVDSQWTYHAPGFDVKYITGGVRYWYHLTGNTPNGSRDAPVEQFTANPLPGILPGVTVFPQERFDYQEKNGFWSHELNLVSTTEGPLQWIAGAYYFDQHYTQPVFTVEEPAQTQWDIAPPFGVCLSGLATQAVSVACQPGIGRRFDNRPDIHDKSWALYGQVSYKVIPTLTLTGGLRYSHDRKYGSESVRLLCFGLPACLSGLPPEIFAAPLDLTGVPSVVAAGIDSIPQGVTGPTRYDQATGFATRNYDASWEAVTGTAKFDWQPDQDTLVYGSYSRGYRSGGLNIGIFTVLSFLPYSQKESVDAFEVGFKKTWSSLNLQTNVALYHYSYDNLQIPITVIQAGGLGAGAISSSTTSFYNVPKSTSQGVELETIWQPIQDLQLIFNYSFIDAKIDRGTAVDAVDPTATQPGAKPIHSLAQCQAGGAAVAGDCSIDDPTNGLAGQGFQRAQDLSGNELPNAPRNKLAFAANYTWHFAAGSLTGGISYSWRDKTYGALFTRWYNEAPSWDQWDARFLWTSKDSKYEIIGYVKNMFDRIGYDQGATAERLQGGFSNLYGPSPAGLTCSPIPTGLGNLAAGQFGTVNCVEGIRKTYYTTPPRTYGVELRYKFF